jgi:hypothetical protein
MISGLVVLTVALALAWLLWLAGDVRARSASARGGGGAARVALAGWRARVVFYAPSVTVQGLGRRSYTSTSPRSSRCTSASC